MEIDCQISARLSFRWYRHRKGPTLPPLPGKPCYIFPTALRRSASGHDHYAGWMHVSCPALPVLAKNRE